MSQASKLKARIHAWLKELKIRLALPSEFSTERSARNRLAYRKEMLSKQYHFMPREF